MPVILSKDTMQYFYPLSLCLWMAIILALLALQGKRATVIFLLSSMGVFWIISAPIFSAFLITSLERQYLPVPISKSPGADAIVVLGGSVGSSENPRLEVDLTNASDRILHTATLYRAGKAPVVIATGGASQSPPEAYAMKELLQVWGVPSSAIQIETRSLNTYQNAVNTKTLLERLEIRRALLVTSAVHMPRALATFRSSGINAIPSPTDYQVVDRETYAIADFLPNLASLGGTSLAVKEYLGMQVYKWRGWIR
jgi:uncharacterized SAM-binding protein YcdF (DUF218 family)